MGLRERAGSADGTLMQSSGLDSDVGGLGRKCRSSGRLNFHASSSSASLAELVLLQHDHSGQRLAELVDSSEYQDLFDGIRDENEATMGGVARDALFAGSLSTQAIFELARSGTWAGFKLYRKAVVSAPRRVTDALGLSTLTNLLGFVDNGINSAQELACASIDAIEERVQACLVAADSLLEERNHHRGDAVRLAFRSDNYTKEAMLCICRLLGKLSLDLHVKNPLKLLGGMRSLAQAQEMARLRRIESRAERLSLAFVPSLRSSDVARWERYMLFSIASYGHQALWAMGVLPESHQEQETKESSEEEFKVGVAAMTGISQKDVLVREEGGGMYNPGYYVALDRVHKQIVVVVRGSMNTHDVLVDLVCEAVPFSSFYSEEDREAVRFEREHNVSSETVYSERGNSDTNDQDTDNDEEEEFKDEESPRDDMVQGMAHRGFLIAAQRLSAKVAPLIRRALKRHSDYSVAVTGHSLGAGVVTLLSLLWLKADTLGSDTEINCVAFGAPCSLCHELSQAPFTRKHITSFVLGDDFVARLSFESVTKMQRAVVAFASLEGAVSDQEKFDLYTQFSTEPCKLFSPGRVWLLESPEFNDHTIEIDPRDLLHSLELTSTFLTFHLPFKYLKAIQDVPSNHNIIDDENSSI